MTSPRHIAVSISTSTSNTSQPVSHISNDEPRRYNLRRSTHNPNLRSHMATSASDAIGKSITASSAESRVPSRRQEVEINFHLSLEETKAKGTMERVENWCQTATTLDRWLMRSPLTPRPFNKEELNGHIYGESEKSDEFMNRINPQDESISNDIQSSLIDGADNDIEGPAFTALATMHRAQEQVRLGIELPPLSVAGIRIEHQTSGYTRKSYLQPSQGPEGSKKGCGDPFNKLVPLPIPKPTTEDPQTYTTLGLTAVLSKLYTPGILPHDVLAALPSQLSLFSLSDPTTPPGHTAHFRSTHSLYLSPFSQKDRNYIAYYIDTLLARNSSLDREVKRLEEDIENAEIVKAELQGDVNRWYAESKRGEKRVEKMVTFMEFLVKNGVGKGDGKEIAEKAKELGIQIGELGATMEVGEEVLKFRKLEEEAKYWMARAEAAEGFIKATA